MPRPPTAATVLHSARSRAGLSQRELARRAGTAQSVVARIEGGQTSPTWDTLERLLGAAGYAVDPVLIPGAVDTSHMLADVARVLALTPEDRLRELAGMSRLVTGAKRV